MSNIIVVNDPKKWPFHIPDVQVISAQEYLTQQSYSQKRGLKIFNLCKNYRYQNIGYYVSLLAEARGHKPLPGVTTIQDIKNISIIRELSYDLNQLIDQTLPSNGDIEFELTIYFGQNFEPQYNKLSLLLFNLFPAPMLKIYFIKSEKWDIKNVELLPTERVPEDHKEFLIQSAMAYFSGHRKYVPKKIKTRYDLAILYNDKDKQSPSNEKAIQKFIKSASKVGLSSEIITKNDYGRLSEFDALFIRETTAVNHYTYRFSRKAFAEGLVVIDDPVSIVRCTNKVFLAELMSRYKIPSPKTNLLYKKNLRQLVDQLIFPVVLKQPDSSFSIGVQKVDNAGELLELAKQLLEKSELLIAQEFLPTGFDWRIGILDRKVIYACKYYMAQGHWQIVEYQKDGQFTEGKSEAVPILNVPKNILNLALKVCNLIGDGLYGVDIKQIEKKSFVIEVNDNPNIDNGVEDSELKDELYHRIMSVFLDRIEQQKMK